MTTHEQIRVRLVQSIAEVPAHDWDACANPDKAAYDPFVSHAFLLALEESGSVSPATGWGPHHLLLEDAQGALLGAMPLYLKGHSMGEFVFDHAWADAYERAGGSYYPKLLAAVPFTPVTGRRVLIRGGSLDWRADALIEAARELTATHDLSSLHLTFPTRAEWESGAGRGLLQRTGQQFHWFNEGYASFEDFLAALSSRKRKAVRRERREAVASGLSIEWLIGYQITEADWDSFLAFYMDTGQRKWGRPYLNRRFFSLIGAAMPERIALCLARREGRAIAGALNFIGGDALFGRYWGTLEHHNCLHFELCYYQAIELAIERRLGRVEAGAQGEHKLARGYIPSTTYSLHFMPDPAFARAVEQFLARERGWVECDNAQLMGMAPFKKTGKTAGPSA